MPTEDLLDEAERVYQQSVRLLDQVSSLRDRKQKRTGTYLKLSPVSVQRSSANRKIAPQRQDMTRHGLIRNVPIGPFAITTHVSIAETCPASCVFRDAGCYAQVGRYGAEIRRLDAAAKSYGPLGVMAAEADAITRLWSRGVPRDGAEGGRDLRLHVAGEASCADGARILAQAVDGFRARGGGACWTYTHRWREISSEDWGAIHALASVESAVELDEAVDLGYVPALTVPAFEGAGAFRVVGSAIQVMPCPAETGTTTCVQCRLCLGTKLRRDRTAVGFALHGTGRSTALPKLATQS